MYVYSSVRLDVARISIEGSEGAGAMYVSPVISAASMLRPH